MNDEELRQRYRRDFTNEPIKTRPMAELSAASADMPAVDSIPSPAIQKKSESKSNVAEPVKSKPRRRLRWRLIVPFIVLILVGGGGYAYFRVYMSSPVPHSIVKSADFEVLYPAKLPAGYQLQKDSFSRTGDIIQYKATNSAGSIISFTSQKRPGNVDFNSTFKQLPESAIFTAPLGQAATGKPSGTVFGIVSTDKSWLIISSASKDISTSDINFIITNAKVAK